MKRHGSRWIGRSVFPMRRPILTSHYGGFDTRPNKCMIFSFRSTSASFATQIGHLSVDASGCRRTACGDSNLSSRKARTGTRWQSRKWSRKWFSLYHSRWDPLWVRTSSISCYEIQLKLSSDYLKILRSQRIASRFLDPGHSGSQPEAAKDDLTAELYSAAMQRTSFRHVCWPFV